MRFKAILTGILSASILIFSANPNISSTLAQALNITQEKFAVKTVEDVKKNDDDGSGLSSALDKTFVFKKD